MSPPELKMSFPELLPFTRDSISTADLGGYESKLARTLSQTDMRPFTESFFPSDGGKNGSCPQVTRDARKISHWLTCRSYGSAELAGEARNWYINVHITARYRNDHNLKIWKARLEQDAKPLVLMTAQVHATAVCHDTIFAILCARWLAPQSMAWRAGLVPKEVWVSILWLVWQTREETDVWSTMVKDFEEEMEPLMEKLED